MTDMTVNTASNQTSSNRVCRSIADEATSPSGNPPPGQTTNSVDRVTLGEWQAGTATGEPSAVVYPRPVSTLSHEEAAQVRADNLARVKDSLLKQYPDVRAQAGIAIRDQLLQAHRINVDPDRTYLNKFFAASSSPLTYNGWKHEAEPVESKSLTELQLHNFPAYYGEDPASLNANTGIYTDGANARSFGTHNEVRLLSTDVKAAVRGNDFYRSYYHQLDQYYERNAGALETVAQASVLQYVEAALRQRPDRPAFSVKALGMLAEAAGHAAGGGASYGTQAHVFDIDSYPSRDMSWLQASDGHIVLLMPGGERPVREFANLGQMRVAVRAMTTTDAGREELARHFSIYNRRDGMTYQGIDKWLGDLSTGDYDERIAYEPQQISGNVFTNQVARMREADLDNVHYLIRSNADVSRQELIQAFGAFNSILGNPLTQAAELGLDLMEIKTAGMGEDREYAVADAWRTSVGLGLSLLTTALTAGLGDPVTSRISIELPARGSTRTLTEDIPMQTFGASVVATAAEAESSRATPSETGASTSTAGVAGTSAAAVAEAGPFAGASTGNAFLNPLGMLERNDFHFLYRVISSSRAALNDPTQVGFWPSGWFEVPRMTAGATLATSSTMDGAITFGNGMYGGGNFNLYQIAAEGLRAASLEENARNNSAALSRHLGYGEDDVVEGWVANGGLSNIGEGAIAYDEVHLSMENLTPDRIRLVPPTEYAQSIPSGYISSSDSRSSLDSSLDESTSV